MKNLQLLLITLCLSVSSLFAQTPEKLSYQAIVRNSSDLILANTNIGMQISILQNSASGTAVYVETQNPITNANGLVSIEIGTGNLVSGTFNTIDWANDVYFIKTEIDITGGSTYTITGTSQLMSVPYALHAKTAENVTNDAVDDADADATNEIQNLDDVLTESNDANGKSIVNTSQIGIGTATPNTSAALDINSTTGTLLLPRITTQERDALTPSAGMMIYNTEDKKFQGYTELGGLDQSQESQNQSFDNSNTAQSFTAGGTSTLNQVDVYLSNSNYGNNDANVTITIREGSGTSGSVLFSQAMPTITGGLTWYSVAITGVNVVAGNQYTIHLTSTSYIDDIFIWGRDNTNPYSGGASYYSNTENTTYDLCFRTHIENYDDWVNLH